MHEEIILHLTYIIIISIIIISLLEKKKGKLSFLDPLIIMRLNLDNLIFFNLLNIQCLFVLKKYFKSLHEGNLIFYVLKPQYKNYITFTCKNY